MKRARWPWGDPDIVVDPKNDFQMRPDSLTGQSEGIFVCHSSCRWAFVLTLQLEVPESLKREDVVGTHKCEAYGSLHNLNYHLCSLQAYLKLYEKWVIIVG